jgi:hypothetical protein
MAFHICSLSSLSISSFPHKREPRDVNWFLALDPRLRGAFAGVTTIHFRLI